MSEKSKNKMRIALMKAKLYCARVIAEFASVETDKGTLIYEGELVEGKEVFLASPDEEPVPAPDGTYTTDSKIIEVTDGVVTSVTDLNGEEENTGNEETGVAAVAEEAKEVLQETVEELTGLVEKLTLSSIESKKETHRLKDDLSAIKQEFESLKKPQAKPVQRHSDANGGPGKHKSFREFVLAGGK